MPVDVRSVDVERSRAVPLPEDSYYQEDLIGLTAYDTEGRLLGRVEDILVTGGTDVLVIRRDGEEILIPATRSICVQVDVVRGRLEVQVPEGLLELNAH